MASTLEAVHEHKGESSTAENSNKLLSEAGFLPPSIFEAMSSAGNNSGLETEAQTHLIKDAASAIFAPRLSKEGNGEREVYDAKFGYANPGSRARFEGDPAYGDKDIDTIYDYTGKVRDFYKTVFGLNSIDGKGMKVVSTGNYGENYQNAFWDGKQMYYGHPSAQSPFKTFVVLDITGHELTHAVTEGQVPGMWRWGEAGALDEHFSDAFGAMADMFVHQTKSADYDWVLGKGAFKDGVHARGVRDMLHPGTAFDDPRIGKDPQPAHMKDLYIGNKDNGGVHINSGIPNKAFALFAKAVGGNSWEDPGHIWFEARKHLTKNPTFSEFSYLTIEQAKATHPDEVDKLKQAWAEVGVVPAPPAEKKP